MGYALKGRNVLVTGGARGLGEVICQQFSKEGCNIAINYLASAERSQALADRLVKEYGVKVILIQGDMGKEADCIRVVQETISGLGGIDIIISNAGYTRFSEFADLSATTAEDWDTCYAVNVKAQHILLREASPAFTANPEGGSLIMSSSIAATHPSGSSMPYSVTKAAQIHLMKCLAFTQGPKIRVNAVLPGLLLTEWGLRYSPEKIQNAKDVAKLKKETDLSDCAQTFLDIARNTSMTGQAITVDSGLGLALP